VGRPDTPDRHHRNDAHETTLGSLAGTPFLVVQRSKGHDAAEPVAELDAVREFARTCADNVADVRPVDVPGETLLAASLPNDEAVEATMHAGGWTQTGDVEYAIPLRSWDGAREPVATAMLASFSEVLPVWSNDLTSPELADAYDPAKRERLVAAIDAWAEASGPDWFTSEPR
jgi:hypothetical protein